MTRSEHLAWSKQRALAYLKTGDLENAFASMCSDLTKHEELCAHPGVEAGVMQRFGGQLQTEEELRDWIEGFR